MLGASLCIAVSIIGCGEKENEAGEGKEEKTVLTVAAAASLKNVFDSIGREFEREHPGTSVQFNYAASNILARQVEQNAPFDVVALAAEETMNQLDSAKLLKSGSRKIFARNRLCVVLSRTADSALGTLSDLTRPSYARIALASPGVPARIYAEEALRSVKLWEALQPRFVYGANVRQVLDYVATGEVDCGFVYTSDAASASMKVALLIDSTLHRPIRYPAAVVGNAKHAAIARTFVEYLQSSKAQELLRTYGFE